MSGIPPRVFTETGTPATEWAATTTTALNTDTPLSGMNPTTKQLFEERQARLDPQEPVSQPFEERHLRHDPFAQASAASTPGHEFPGAFPRSEESVPHDDLRTTAVKLADSVSSTASSSLSSAYQSAAQYLPQSVVNTVSSYVPASYIKDKDVAVASVHDQPHHISLPSKELSGAGEHEFSEGVGSLPGRVDESDVTEVPEQPAEHPSKFQAAYKSDALPVAAGFASLPSQELSGAKPFEHSGGVGALPGRSTEPAVATLPDDNTRGATNATSGAVGTHARTLAAATLPSQDDDAPSAVSGGVGTLPGSSAETGVALLPAERDGQNGYAGVQPARSTETTLHRDDGKTRTGEMKDPKMAESETMAERARGVGAESHDAMYGGAGVQPSQGARPPADSAAGAAAVGAAVGQNQMQRREEKHSGTEVQLCQDPRAPANSGAGEAVFGAAAGQNAMRKHEEKQSDIGVRESQGVRPPADSNAGAAAIGAAVGQNQMQKHEEKKEQKKEQKDAKDGSLGSKAHAQPNKGEGYDTDYHPAALHPGDKHMDSDAKHTEGGPAAEKDGEHAHAHTDDAHDNDHDDAGGAQKTKKAGFMQKMKGEALTLLGKVEKKPHKVEEGQRLKHGEPAQAQEAAPAQQ